MVRSLADVIDDQEGTFAELLAAQRELQNLSRAGQQMGIVDGDTSEVDEAVVRIHAAQHQLDALGAEAIQAAVNAAPGS